MLKRYAPYGFCPVLNCGKELPSPNAIVCEDHYFCVPTEQMQRAMRMKIKSKTEEDLARRAVFADQAAKHTKAIVNTIKSQDARP